MWWSRFSRTPLLIDCALAAVSGALLALSFPGAEISWLAWVALAPLFITLRSGAGAVRAFALSFATGTVFFWALMWWALELRGFHFLNWGLANLVNAFWFGLFGVLASVAHRRVPRWSVLALPAAWVVCEWAKLHASWLSFPWGVLGTSQASVLPVVQVARLGGIYAVSFLVVLVNAAIVEAIVRRTAPARALVPVAGAALALIAAFAYGNARLDDFAGAPRTDVAIIQANAHWDGERDMARRLAVLEAYAKLTREVAASKPALIAWPSDSIPAYLPRDRVFGQRLAEIAVESGTFLLAGSSGQEKFQALPGPQRRDPANSAFLWSPSGKVVGRYEKIRLLPFDEYLPLRGIVPWPEAIAHSRPTDFQPGKELTVFHAGETRFGVMNCWENLFPDLFRQMAGRAVDTVVSMTNESFTESVTAHRQMLAMNVVRAVENHIAIVRTSTTGISAFIDPDGRLRETIPHGVARSLVASVPLGRERTLYTRAGDWLPAMLAAFLALVMLAPQASARAAHERRPLLGGGPAVPESS
jgi:apolipoprotein N-acyltransferase